MSSFWVVADACVLYPASLRDTLLWAAHEGLYRIYWSNEILQELQRNLVKNGACNESQAAHLLAEMRRAFPQALVTGHECLIPSMPNHTKDRHVLAAAVFAHAQVIVTENRKDFPVRALGQFNIEAQTADVFLSNLYDLDAEAMVQALRRQAGTWKRPPLEVNGLLQILERTVPKFVSLVRADLKDLD